MRADRAAAIAGALGLLLCAAMTASAQSVLPRGALGAVVRSCVLAKSAVGTPFPCLDVQLPSGGEPGFTVIRAPGQTTHIIVTPTEQISGVESPVLLRPPAGAYWRAAFGARRYVSAATDGRVPLDAVGLALNSRRTRSQDQLHIHAECIRPDILQAIRTQAAEIGSAWHLLPRAIDHDRLFGRVLTTAAIANTNLFELLAEIPGLRSDLSQVTALVVPAGGTGGEPGRFYMLAGAARSRSIEGYLDESCAATLRRR